MRQRSCPVPRFCRLEKQVSILPGSCAPIAAKPGKPAKQDNEYERCGTANVFAVVEPKSGRHFTTATPQVADRLLRRTGGQLSLESAEVHYTPKHGSWLNQAEIELSLYSRQCLGKRRFPDVGTLRRETKAWNRTANRQRTKITWRFTRRKARKVFRYAKPRRAE